MTRIEIRTQNVAGDEELVEHLRRILDQYENEGDVSGEFEGDDGETVSWAINPAQPQI